MGQVTGLMQAVNDEVLNERKRQNAKWGHQRHDYGFWLAILGEEFGEVCQAIQQGSVASKYTDADDLYTELIHVAAVASAIAEQVKEERERSQRYAQNAISDD
ncbi:MazG-like family protein [Sporosarcina sp. FSL W7-1349]|uniref:MazG-like family protein n=1 Tax=Sporosarcina sp. FSL W7-1349 TaxID=2921561 RepID=UPI0030F58787